MGSLHSTKTGFNIFEILIVLVVLTGLAMIAYPAYLNLTHRYYYADMIEKITPYKVAIAKCYALLNKFEGCDAGKQKIPPNIITPTGNVAAATVKNGVITVTPVARRDILASDIYVLTPVYKDQTVSFVGSGPAVGKQFTK